MPLSTLSIRNLRNLREVEFSAAPGLNLFYGENGAGKTTVLEAISFLGLGRSFKSRKHLTLINHESDSLTVHCKLSTDDTVGSIGLSRARRSKHNRTQADGINITNTSTLAEYLPLQWIDTRALELLGGPPALRRGFLDWYLFHVKHQFKLVYQNYQQTLKHRNALLRRDKIAHPQELVLWTERLSKYGESLHELRSGFIHELANALLAPTHVSELDATRSLELKYGSGWDEKASLNEALNASMDQDRKRGFTGVGPHKADVTFRAQGRDLADILSRGQTKKFVYQLYLAQIEAVQKHTGKRVVLLMDDFPAELDSANRKTITEIVESLTTQIFVTGIEKQALQIGWSKASLAQAKMFHVKHGRLEADQDLQDGDVNDRQ